MNSIDHENIHMKPEFSVRGGAIIGTATIIWPFVKLAVYPDELIIIPSFKIALSGVYEYVFPSNRVTSLERYSFFPVFFWGIKVNHYVSNFPPTIIFWCFENPSKLIQRIHEAGFIIGVDP